MIPSRSFRIFIAVLLIIWTSSLIYFWFTPYQSELNSSAALVDQLKVKLNDLTKQYDELLNKTIRLRLLDDKDQIVNLGNASDTLFNNRKMRNIYLTRRINTNLHELYNLVYQSKNPNSLALKSIQSLIANSDLMIDEKWDNMWRKEELESLANLMKKRLHALQNPADCNFANKVICPIEKGCGFGCKIHHITYCLIVAYSMRRTLIFDTTSWRYGEWNSVFLPLSEKCLNYNHHDSSVQWKGEEVPSNVKNVHIPIIDFITMTPTFFPQAIPEDIYSRLVMVHSDPFVWFVGQMLTYIMRLNSNMKKVLSVVNDGMYNKIPKEYPVVGVHIRRTDKIGFEAEFHDLSEYMSHVESYFQKEELKANLQMILDNKEYYKRPAQRPTIKLKRKIVLATDDPNLFDEIRLKYPTYDVIGSESNSKTANLASRYNMDGLNGVVIDMLFLSQTSFLVCTFSSQVCRVAYELMQSKSKISRTGDQGNKFKSLDDIFYFGGQQSNYMVMVQNHHFPNFFKKPNKKEEIDAKKRQKTDEENDFYFTKLYNSFLADKTLVPGDLLTIRGNHWDGFSRGDYKGVDCLFPTYKAQFLHIVTKMGNYDVDTEV